MRPFSRVDFDVFVDKMLTDPLVVEHYHSFRGQTRSEEIRAQAEQDFWGHFEKSRVATDCEVFAVFEGPIAADNNVEMVGWAGLLETSLSREHGGPELQYMLASEVHGRGYATEAAAEVLRDAELRKIASPIIATVDIPNTGSIRVLEKLGFLKVGKVEAYGSSDMFLYTYDLTSTSSD